MARGFEWRVEEEFSVIAGMQNMFHRNYAANTRGLANASRVLYVAIYHLPNVGGGRYEQPAPDHVVQIQRPVLGSGYQGQSQNAPPSYNDAIGPNQHQPQFGVSKGDPYSR